MRQINLSILQSCPRLTIRAMLEIKPLAPLSMATDIPGSYYKTLKSPDKKMLCGLIENILGWHIDLSDRKKVIKELKSVREKQKKEYRDFAGGSTYIPLLMEYFDLEDKIVMDFSRVCFYDDYWKRLHRRADAVNHPKGTINIDYRLIPLKCNLPKDAKKENLIDSKALESFFKKNIGGYPFFYSSPATREYVDIDGCYRYNMVLDVRLYNLLVERLKSNNCGYLGNSEGWVDLKISKL